MKSLDRVSLDQLQQQISERLALIEEQRQRMEKLERTFKPQ